MDNAMPRSFAANMSAMTPPALVSGEEPMAPAKKRRMMRVQMFWAPAAPALKKVMTAYVPMKRYCLPKSSKPVLKSASFCKSVGSRSSQG